MLSGTHPGLQQVDGDLGGTRDIQGETELYDFRARAGGKAAIIPVLSYLSVQTTGRCHFVCVCVQPSCQTAKYEFHWLDEICSLHPGDSLDLSPAQLVHCWKHFQLWMASPGLHCCLSWTTLDGPQAYVGSNWPLCALRLLLSDPRLGTGTRPESALTW